MATVICVFVAILGGLVVSKMTVLLAASNIRKGTPLYCITYLRFGFDGNYTSCFLLKVWSRWCFHANQHRIEEIIATENDKEVQIINFFVTVHIAWSPYFSFRKYYLPFAAQKNEWLVPSVVTHCYTLLMQIAMFQTKLFRSMLVIVGFFFLKRGLMWKTW